MPLPESQKENEDLVDLLITSYQSVEESEGPDGTKQKNLVLEPEIAYWQLHKVNSPRFARFVLKLKKFEAKAADCYNNMSHERADVMAKQILAIGKAYRRSIDAKSSESRVDMRNAQETLIDTLKQNKVTRSYVMKGDDVKNGALAGLFGKRASERDDD